jgi:hypothetical protein
MTLISWERTDTVKENTEDLLDASKEIGLEVNPEKKCMLMSYYQNIGQKHSIKVANRSFEDVAKFRYVGKTLTDQSCMHKEIKSRLNSGMLATIRFRVFCPPACCIGT